MIKYSSALPTEMPFTHDFKLTFKSLGCKSECMWTTSVKPSSGGTETDKTRIASHCNTALTCVQFLD